MVRLFREYTTFQTPVAVSDWQLSLFQTWQVIGICAHCHEQLWSPVGTCGLRKGSLSRQSQSGWVRMFSDPLDIVAGFCAPANNRCLTSRHFFCQFFWEVVKCFWGRRHCLGERATSRLYPATNLHLNCNLIIFLQYIEKYQERVNYFLLYVTVVVFITNFYCRHLVLLLLSLKIIERTVDILLLVSVT